MHVVCKDPLRVEERSTNLLYMMHDRPRVQTARKRPYMVHSLHEVFGDALGTAASSCNTQDWTGKRSRERIAATSCLMAVEQILVRASFHT